VLFDNSQRGGDGDLRPLKLFIVLYLVLCVGSERFHCAAEGTAKSE